MKTLQEVSAFKLPCGCTPDASGYGYCGKCVKALRTKIWREMPESKKEYDRQFAPVESEKYDEYIAEEHNTCCSCHINPPCSYCTSQNSDDE